MTSNVVELGRQAGASGVRSGSCSAPIEVVVAYKQPIVRCGIGLLLDSVEDFEVVAESGDLEGARRHVKGHHPRVLVLDLDLDAEGCSAIGAIPRFLADSPGTGIVAMSLAHNATLVREVIGAGALGYVAASGTADDLLDAVRRVGAGQAFMSPEILAALARPAGVDPSELSPREEAVIGLIAMGHTNAEIAEQLFLSVRTVETHRAKIHMKLGRRGRAELVAYAVEHGITGAGVTPPGNVPERLSLARPPRSRAERRRA